MNKIVIKLFLIIAAFLTAVESTQTSFGAVIKWTGGDPAGNLWGEEDNWDAGNPPNMFSDVRVGGIAMSGHIFAQISNSQYPQSSPAKMKSLETWFGGGTEVPMVLITSGYAVVNDGVVPTRDNVVIGGRNNKSGEIRLFSNHANSPTIPGDLAVYGDTLIKEGIFSNRGGNHHHEKDPLDPTPPLSLLQVGEVASSTSKYVVDQEADTEAKLKVDRVQLGISGQENAIGIFEYVSGHTIEFDEMKILDGGQLVVKSDLNVTGGADLIINGGEMDIDANIKLTVKTFKWSYKSGLSRKMSSGTITFDGSDVVLDSVVIVSN